MMKVLFLFGLLTSLITLTMSLLGSISLENKYFPVMAMLFAWSVVGYYRCAAKEALLLPKPDNPSNFQRLKRFIAEKLVYVVNAIFYLVCAAMLYVTFRAISFML